MDPISIIGIVVTLLSIGFALWERRESKRVEAERSALIKSIPDVVAAQVRQIFRVGPNKANQLEAERDEQHSQTPGVVNSWPHAIDYADIDGDGRSELLIQFPAGVHGSNLRIFAWKDFDFVEIGSLASGTPGGFEFEDFDKDGRIEVVATETDWEAGLPYSSAPRMRVYYRWNGRDFDEVATKREHQSQPEFRAT